MSEIPVMIHHESDQKPSKGLRKKQSYLKYVMKQAEKYNKRVILFGDEYNKEWATEWYRSDDYVSDKWKRFEKSFVNMSDYTDEWAKGIFRRFFVFEEFCKRNNLNDFVVLDSDVLIYRNMGEYPFRGHCDGAFEWREWTEFDLNKSRNGAVVCGIGYMTYDSVCSFTDFCINVYEDKDCDTFRRLNEMWNTMLVNKSPGGVCEMMLLYHWICNTGIKAINLLERQNDSCFCTNYNGESNLRAGEFRIHSLLNVKVLRFQSGFPYHFDKDEGKWIRVYDIHFGGDSKRFIPDIYKHNTITLYNWIYYTLIRCWRCKIKPIIKR